MRRPLLLAALLFSGACFLGSPPFVLPTPADGPALDARLREDSTDVDAVVSLAALDLTQGRPESARALLERTHARLPGDPILPLLLGVAEEETDGVADARARYEAYRSAHGGPLGRRAAIRSAALRARALREGTRRALDGPPPAGAPRTGVVAVLPFAHAGGPEAGALAAAISTLVAWDTAEDWTVVDDLLVRVLLDEMGLPPGAWGDLSVGVEVGLRVGAARVVQGVVGTAASGAVSWDVTVLTIRDEGSFELVHRRMEGSADEVLAMERRLAAVVREALEGIVLRDPRGRGHTGSREALLALGRGLLALDVDDSEGARSAFAAAVDLDPTFVEAAALVRGMDAVLAERATPLERVLEEVARVGERQRAVTALRGAPGSTHQGAANGVGARDRAFLSDLLGLDAAGGGGLLDVTFALPAGTP